jgi:ferredoxin
VSPPRPWSVAADHGLCIGSGVCTVYAPTAFSQDERAKVVLLDPPASDLDAVRAAVEACPTRALTLNVDDES